jgi:hypothetical protein
MIRHSRDQDVSFGLQFSTNPVCGLVVQQALPPSFDNKLREKNHNGLLFRNMGINSFDKFQERLNKGTVPRFEHN